MKRKLQLTVIVSSLLLTTFAMGKGNPGRTCMYSFNDEYHWYDAPPLGMDTVDMMYISYLWNPYGGIQAGYMGNFKMEASKIQVAHCADSLYLKILPLTNSNDDIALRTYGWIKAVKNGVSLRFPNKSMLGYVSYDKITWPDGFTEYDTVYNNLDTIYINTVSIGPDTIKYHENNFWSGGDFKERRWPVEYLDEEVVADYGTETGLISNPSADLLVSSQQYQDYISNWNLRDELAIKDFMIGCIATELPDELPAPEVTYTLSSSPYENCNGVGCYVTLDIVNEKGEILNANNIYTVFYIDGDYAPFWNPDSLVKTKPSVKGMTPSTLKKIHPRISVGVYRNFKGLEVMCYYEKEDGTRIESPRVKAVDVTGVKDVMADRVGPNIIGDGKVYDLAGREVNPDRLSPGIYIRNGRKFTVTRQ